MSWPSPAPAAAMAQAALGEIVASALVVAVTGRVDDDGAESATVEQHWPTP